MAIALIDYGAGNLASVRKGFAAVGADLVTPAWPGALDAVSGIVVPGVGHFAATAALTDQWRAAIHRRVEAGVPLLGICLGMQWLFDGSEEAPDRAGAGLLAGRCWRMTAEWPRKIPHVGWNTIDVCRADTIVDGIASGSHLYFTHAFAAPAGEHTVAVSTHGSCFASVVQRGHVAGVQFHPEKSGPAGLRILSNFLAMVKR